VRRILQGIGLTPRRLKAAKLSYSENLRFPRYVFDLAGGCELRREAVLVSFWGISTATTRPTEPVFSVDKEWLNGQTVDPRFVDPISRYAAILALSEEFVEAVGGRWGGPRLRFGLVCNWQIPKTSHSTQPSHKIHPHG